MKTRLAVATMLASAAFPACAFTAVVPRWRVNPISAAAISAEPTLANAISVSLLINLTGPSLFNVAGVDLTGLLPGVTIYNNSFGANSSAPIPALVGVFPALAFDTYVCVSDPAISSSVPASIPGAGHPPLAVFGPETFIVAWGATPNTGPLGGTDLEIARITMLGDATRPSTLFLPPDRAEVRSSDEPNTAIPLPPMPTPFIPEPAAGAVVAVFLSAVRHGRRK